MRFDRDDLDLLLADFLGKPWKRFAEGPDAYDCYTLVKAVTARLGIDMADIGKVDPQDSRPIYEQQQTDYIQLPWPRPWSLVTFSSKDLRAHIGLVLPNDNLFLHCPGRAAGKVLAEPLSRRPWRDSIDGYWWPKGYVEAVVLLSPLATTRRAWQFVKAARPLSEIIEQDIVEGKDIPVQAFLDGQLIEDWTVVPTELQQLVIRPLPGEGEQGLAVGGMLALAIFAPYIMGAIAPGLSAAAVSGAANASTVFAYKLGVAAIAMTGGLAMTALARSEEAEREGSQHNTWQPHTQQHVGGLLPLVYGTYGVRGEIISAFVNSQTETLTDFFSKDYLTSDGADLLNMKIAYSDGPIEGIVAGTERLNDREPDFYDGADDYAVEHFVGNADQAASTVPDAFQLLIDQRAYYNTPVTFAFTAVDCDRAGVVVRFDTYFCYKSTDGSISNGVVSWLIEVRAAGGSWHTLMEDDVRSGMNHGIHLVYYFDGTYTGGSAFSISAGNSYEVRLTRQSTPHTGNELFYLDTIQCEFATAQKHPGIAYTAVSAAAMRELSGSIDYYAQIQGKLVRIYDDGTETWSIAWSDNPAWVAFDLLTRPVIAGNGDGTPYSVEYYKRANPSYLTRYLAEWVAWADWCDELVDDGNGGTEKRYRFNGVFDDDGSAWDQASRVAHAFCAVLVPHGHHVGVRIDKPATPVAMFNVSNMRTGFSETWIDTSEAATVLDVQFAAETSDYSRESFPVPLAGADQDIPASMDGFGHTKRSQVWRRAVRQLRQNKYMKRMVALPACIDSMYATLGDVVYVQHPALQRATGGRVVAVYADGVMLDQAVTMGAGDHALLIRTHDGSVDQLTLYEVASVSGADDNIVTIVGAWEYTPEVNDLFTFGLEVKVIDLYRLKGSDRTADGRVQLDAAQYTTDYYTDDEAAPQVEAQSYTTTKGGRNPALLPTTAEAIAAGRLDPSSDVDALTWEGLTFVGDAVDTVTWSCSGDDGEGIRYRGTWCPIIDDAVGTTDKYIYFDPNIGDPRYLEHTDDLTDLAGLERYLFCENIDGVAYARQGLLIAADAVKLDGVEEGATAGATWGVNIANQPDHLFQTFYQAAAPTVGVDTGDFWIDSDDGKTYRYNGATWDEVQDGDVAQALSDAADAQATADGKITTFVQTTSPTAEGTGDLWVDSDDDNKLYRWSGSAWVAVAYDVATWSKIVGLGKPDDNADVTADNQIGIFEETFADPNGDVATRWPQYGGATEVATVAGIGVAGGKVLRVGDNSGNDYTQLIYYRSTPFDPSALYRMTIRLRQTAGTGVTYIGVIGRNAADDGWTDRNGGTTYTYSQYPVCYGESIGSSWEVHTGYFGGTAATGRDVASPDPSDPSPIQEDIRFIRPTLYVNHSAAAGTVEIDTVVIAKMTAGVISRRATTAASNPQTGWIWYDTSANPTLVKRYNGTSWDIIGVDLQTWLHGVDPTKLDGSHIYPSTVDTDQLNANCVTATKMLINQLSAISAVLGDVVAGTITGTTITGGILRTATSGRYVKIDEDGIKFIMEGGSGISGTTGNGGSNIVVGTTGNGGDNYIVGAGMLARFYNTATGIPFDIVSEQASLADMHLFPRSSDPTTGKPGDIALVNNKLRVCTAATPTWAEI